MNFTTHYLLSPDIPLTGIIIGNREQQTDFVRALETTGIQPVIDTTFPLEQLRDAFTLEESQKHFGKICISL